MAWFSAGVQTNPATDAILADTAALGTFGGNIATVTLGANVAVVCSVEHRNAANNANLHSQVIACAANEVVQLNFPISDWATGERLRVRVNVGVTGSVQASIFSF